MNALIFTRLHGASHITLHKPSGIESLDMIAHKTLESMDLTVVVNPEWSVCLECSRTFLADPYIKFTTVIPDLHRMLLIVSEVTSIPGKRSH